MEWRKMRWNPFCLKRGARSWKRKSPAERLKILAGCRASREYTAEELQIFADSKLGKIPRKLRDEFHARL